MLALRSIIAGAAVLASAVLSPVAAQRDTSGTRPRRFEWLTGIPGTLGGAAREVTRSKNVPTELGVVALTAVLIAADQHLYEQTRRAGTAIGLSPEHPEFAVRVGGMKLFNAPTTISSAFYYLGDGWPTMMVAGAFYVTGKVRHNNRALRTASEITQSLFSLGIITQSIKRMTGRQTPSSATVPGGRWRPFTNFNEYMKNTPQYDAFPSGHLATAMSTITVIALNYPENRWVRPIGYALMTGLSFAMVNSGVHWVSDYPLALAIGGTIGTVAVRRARRPALVDGPHPGAELRIEPILTPAAIGLHVRW